MARIFISYRRQDAKYQARSIYAAFAREVGRENVFMDVDSIPPGANFRKILKDWVDRCEVLLALIGPDWIDARDLQTGQRRLENPSDFVRIEIGQALGRDIPVVPVLLDGAPLPQVHQLPDDLKELCDRHAELVEYRTFDADVERLIKKLQLGVKPQPGPAPIKSDDGRIKIDAATVHGAPDGRFLPGNGKSEWFKDHPLAPEMAIIPKGQFVMGSPAGEEGRYDDEGPQHQVAIKVPFAISRSPITLAQYSLFVTQNGRETPSGSYIWDGDDWRYDEACSYKNPGYLTSPTFPVTCVNWQEAVAYAEWLRQYSGRNYRLLTESEWEYAARAGKMGPFCWANLFIPNMHVMPPQIRSLPEKALSLVSPARPMLGDCMTCTVTLQSGVRMFGIPITKKHRDDGSPWTTGDQSCRVVRGGSWRCSATNLRCASRNSAMVSLRDNSIGFRVACDV